MSWMDETQKRPALDTTGERAGAPGMAGMEGTAKSPAARANARSFTPPTPPSATARRPAVRTSAPSSASPARERMRWLEPLIVALVALGFSLTRLGGPSLWMDEAFSVQLARQPLSVVLASYTTGAESNMIAYTLALSGWLRLGAALGLPASEAFVRLPSALLAAGSAVALYLLGRRFLGRTAAVVAAVIYVASGWQLTYAQEARGYALQLALVTLGWLALLAAFAATPSTGSAESARGWRAWRWWLLFVPVMALGVYTQATTLLMLLAQALAVGLWLVWPGAWMESWRGRAWAALRPALVAFVAVGLLAAPFVWVSRGGSKTGWLAAPSLGELVAKLSSLAGGGRKAELALAGLVVVVIAAAVLAWLSLTPAGKRLRGRAPGWLSGLARLGGADSGALAAESAPVALGLALWVLAPVVISYLISLGPTRIFSSRYLVDILPALCLLVGAGVAALRWRAGRLAALALVALVMLALVPSYYAHAQVEDWRAPARWLERAYQPGDGLVSYNNVQGCELPVEYYLETDASPARFTADSPGVIRWALYTQGGDPLGQFTQALDPAALAAFAGRHPRIFFIEGRFTDAADAARAHATQAWLDAHYTFVSQTSSATVTIRLYDTGGAAG